MKPVVFVVGLLVAVGCGKGGSSSSTGGSGGTATSSGAKPWGCQNSGTTCVCQTSPAPGEFPDAACTLSTPTCAFTQPSSSSPGETECVESTSIPASSCAQTIAATAGAVSVTRCPPPAVTTASSTASNGGTTNGGTTNGGTTQGSANGTTATGSTTTSSAATSGSASAGWTNGTAAGPSGGTGGTANSTGTTGASGTTSSNAATSTSSTTSSNAATSTSSTSGTTSSNSATSTSSTSSTSGTTSSNAATSTSSTSSTSSTTGTNGTTSSNSATSTSSTNGTTGATGSGTTGSGSGGAGTTGSPAGLNSGYGTVTGANAFTVAGAFEATGTDNQTGRPQLKFMMFSAPMTCAMFQARIFPLYYGYLPDQRITFTNDSTAAHVQYPDTAQAVFNPTDGGSPYYVQTNGTPAPYSPIALTPFPGSTPITVGIITSTSSTPVGTGSYGVGNNTNNIFGTGTLGLANGSRPTFTSGASDGTVDYVSYNSGGLSGDFSANVLGSAAGTSGAMSGTFTAIPCSGF